jgi:MYXO-CTERM domain-containing protein
MRPLRLCTALVILASSTPALADSLASGSPGDLLDIDDEWITGLMEPTGMAFLPDGRLVITQRGGAVRVRNDDGSLDTAGTIMVGTSFQEKGLLNVAVHPDYANNNIIFLYYTASSDVNRVVSIELSADNMLDMGTETPIVDDIAAPLNHNGGGLAVDEDYLYIGTGDSGSNTNARPSALDIGNYYSTCFTNLNGKVLRLNLDGTIPSDNPLVGQTADACGNNTGTAPSSTTDMARGEIFAWGFRNAYRLWSDPLTRNLWVGHVGEVTFEMVNVVAPAGGEHHGWPFREGNDGQPASACEEVEPNVGACKDAVYRCESNNMMGDYDPDVPNDCNCMIGGLILTGCEWPDEFEGQYLFGDYSSQNVWTLQTNEDRNDVIAERVAFMTPSGGGPTNFVEHEGALYIAVYGGNGHITRIAPKTPEAACAGEPSPGGGAGGETAAGGMSTMAGAAGTTAGGGTTAQGGTPGTAGGPAAGGTPAGGGDGPGPTPVGGGGEGGSGAPVGGGGPGNPGGGDGPGSTPGPVPAPNPGTPVPNPSPNGSNPAPSATTPAPSGTDGEGSEPGTDSAASDDGGCGCRVVGSEEQSSAFGNSAGLLALLGLSLFAVRRRRS